MRFIIRFAALLILCFPFCAFAQEKPTAKIPRVLILLDGSSSMGETWAPGKTRFQQAGKFILSLIDSLGKANSEVEFGLRVFGHQYPSQQKNCFDTKLEVKFSRYNTTQMQSRLEDLHGYGVSPIAYSLSEAAMEDFENENKYAYSIVLVTDGGESCDGDICKVVNNLLSRKIFFRPYIVSLLDYAPLKDLYSCLGTFLTVSTEPQMPITITKIVDAHREGFERAKTGVSIDVMPSIKKTDTAVKQGEILIPITMITDPVTGKTRIVANSVKDTIKLTPIKRDTSNKPISNPVKIKTEPTKNIKPEKIAEPIKAVEPKPVAQIRYNRVVKPLKLNTRLRTFKTIMVELPQPKYLPVPAFRNTTVGDAPKVVIPPRPKEKAIRVLPYSKMKLVRRSLTALPNPKKLIVPEFVMPIIEIPKPEPIAVKPIIAPKIEPKKIIEPTIKVAEKPINKKEEQPAFVIHKSPAAETLLEVYFTDGRGTFYPSTPQILLTDPTTNKSIKQFHRTVNPDGNPDPQKVLAGTYNLSVVGSNRTFLKSVTVEPNMKNKIVITVGPASIQFVWRGRSDNIPVHKYSASVKRNFVPQPTVMQKCDTVLPYPPGNYHIEINTLPVTVRSGDLSIDATTMVPIDEPGTIQISNTNKLGKVMFYFQKGDRFLPFLPMNINGNPGAQKEEIMPGQYEIHFTLAPGLPEKTLVFHIKSNETSTIELK